MHIDNFTHITVPMKKTPAVRSNCDINEHIFHNFVFSKGVNIMASYVCESGTFALETWRDQGGTNKHDKGSGEHSEHNLQNTR